MTAPNPLYQEGYSMTDTTDQQAVTVAQEDREAAAKIYELLGFGPCQHIIDGVEDDVGVVQIVAQRSAEVAGFALTALKYYAENDHYDGGDVPGHIYVLDDHGRYAREALNRLASVSSASADLPADVRALVIAAREFWENEDRGTILSHALDKALAAFSSRVPYADEPTPEPVPATNQAGEVERLRSDLEKHAERCEAEITLVPPIYTRNQWVSKESARLLRLAALSLATQPATSQEGEDRENDLRACKNCGAPAGFDCRTGQGRIPPCHGREQTAKWLERWYGSEPQKGSAIVDERGTLIAYFGGDKTTHKATTAAVSAHNAFIATQPATSQEGEETISDEQINDAIRHGFGDRFADDGQGVLDPAELLAALEPFAAACNISTADDSESLYDTLAAEKLTWRDLRRARAVWKAASC